MTGEFKTCPQCKVRYFGDLDDYFYFRKDQGNYKSPCKRCLRKKRMEYYYKNKDKNKPETKG